MVFNIIVGFVIPWILGIMLYKKNSKVILFIAPIASVVSFIINQIGFTANYWRLTPIYDGNTSFTAIPFDVGLYPFFACLMIYIILNTKIKPFYILFFITMITTISEYLMLLFKRLTYYNGWNMFYTFMSYAIAYIVTYLYFYKIKKFVFRNNGF